ncbi:MAG: hypothetical protein AAF086_08930 [Planctomycetota bacterium]
MSNQYRVSRSLCAILAFAMLHFITFWGILIGLFGVYGFDLDNPPTTTERFFSGVVKCLAFPIETLVFILPRRLGDDGTWEPFLINSLLWGVALWLLRGFIARTFQARLRPKT